MASRYARFPFVVDTKYEFGIVSLYNAMLTLSIMHSYPLSRVQSVTTPIGGSHINSSGTILVNRGRLTLSNVNCADQLGIYAIAFLI